jgi:GAF domain-containing protein
MTELSRTPHLEISEDILNRWQNIVDMMAELIGIPAALIMRLVDSDIEVFVSSKSDGNPYHRGNSEHFLGSGLYCEKVIKTKSMLLIPNALADEEWRNNPDIELNMISYLGFPILMPDGQPFGTICVLDNRENAYSDTYKKLIMNFRDVIQSHLELIHMNEVLGEKNRNVSDYLTEIEMLRAIVPICSHCKKIRDAEGNWIEVEDYVSKHMEAQLSHGICPECKDQHYSDLR